MSAIFITAMSMDNVHHQLDAQYLSSCQSNTPQQLRVLFPTHQP